MTSLPLSHLLQDDQALLDDFDSLGVADDLALLLYDLAEVDRPVEVIHAVKVIEVVEGRVASPMVEGDGVSAAGWM